MGLTLFFATLAGIGGGLAWGYRTALNVALGGRAKPVRDSNSNTPLLPVGGKREAQEYVR